MLDIYELARAGESDNKIAETLGLSIAGFRKWKTGKRMVNLALKKARAAINNNNTHTFSEYVYGRLPDNLQELWEEINAAEESDNVAEIIDSFMGDVASRKRARQHLFVYALVHTAFNPSEACRIVGIARTTYQSWTEEPAFQELLTYIHEAKKDFFEGALIQRVIDGDTSATIFVNRTQNADRGYNEKLTVDHRGTVQHNHLHAHITFDQIVNHLDVETQRKVLHAIRVVKEDQERAAITDGERRSA